MQERVQRLLDSCPGAAPEYLESSGWLYDRSIEQVEAVVGEFTARFHGHLEQMTDLLGAPALSSEGGRDWLDSWCPEAIHAAAWRPDGNMLCLALEHQDRETPVAVTLRCLTDAEIEEQSE